MTIRLTDSEKLIVIAAWFDAFDAKDTEWRQRFLDDSRSPARNDVQKDLRRIADRLKKIDGEP